MKQHHIIEIFSANCPLCKHITDGIQIGKCEGCYQIVYDTNKMTEDVKSKMKKYGLICCCHLDYIDSRDGRLIIL